MRRRQLLWAGALAPLPGLAGAADAPTVRWQDLTLLDGSAPASWVGQPAVLVFWATWCAYCKRHNAHIDALHRAAPGRPRLLGVAVDTDPALVRRVVQEQGWRFPVALDGGVRDRLTRRRMVPMTCLIDAQGRLLQAIPGEMAASDVMDLPQALQRLTT